MRLTQNEADIIKTNILKYIKDAKIVLFGSRVYDDKKGGDIDIFVETKQTITLKQKIEILTYFEIDGIDRKVDLIIKTPNTKYQPIFDTIYKEGIVL